MTNIEDEDDDFPIDLPPLGKLTDVDDTLDSEELGIEELPESSEADESVGLDDSEGVEGDEALFALDLPPPEAERVEPEVDAIPIEGLDGDDEYGWTETGASEEAWDPSDVDLPSLRPLGREDGGEEGVEDLGLGVGVSADGDDDDASHLPPLEALDAELEDDFEDLVLGEDALIDTSSLEPLTEVSERADEGVTTLHLEPAVDANHRRRTGRSGDCGGTATSDRTRGTDGTARNGVCVRCSCESGAAPSDRSRHRQPRNRCTRCPHT